MSLCNVEEKKTPQANNRGIELSVKNAENEDP